MSVRPSPAEEVPGVTVADDRQPASEAAGNEPLTTVTSGGVTFTILGTAHVSAQSAEAVRRLLDSSDFDAVAIELDRGRHSAITKPDRWQQLDLFQVIREGRAGILVARLALVALQQRQADQVVIEPGLVITTAIRSEMVH